MQSSLDNQVPADSATWLPLFVDMAGEPCLVIGAGKVAARKTAALLKAGAQVTIVAPSCSQEMQELLEKYAATYHVRQYCSTDISNNRLIVAATDDPELNAAIAKTARLRGVWANVVSPGHSSNAVIPATINRAPIQIALFSGGTAPALMRLLQRQLEAFIPTSYSRLATFAGLWRTRVHRILNLDLKRQSFWREFFASQATEQFLAGDETHAHQWIEKYLVGDSLNKGHIDILGIGSGDPQLLTLRALRLMQLADIVVHEVLMPPAILEILPFDTERVEVASLTSEMTSVQNMLIKQAQQGRRVICLWPGDPVANELVRITMASIVAAGIACRLVLSTTNSISDLN